MTYLRIARISKAWARVESILIGMLTLSSLLLSIYAMASRYIAPQHALDWTTEVIVYLVTWAFLLAGSRALIDADHVRADLLTNFLPLSLNRYLTLFQNICAFLFCIAVMIGGIQVVLLSLRIAERSDSSLSLPMWVYYLCLPVAFASISGRYIGRIFVAIRSIQQAQMKHHSRISDSE
jgi:C4-dicarboxylate transporter DctQ subunit